MAPKKRQHRPIPRYLDKVYSPPRLCSWNIKFDAFKLLCNSPDAISIGSNTSPVTPRGRTSIEQLPAELLVAIFAYLNHDDFIALSLCSQAFWIYAIQMSKNGYLEWKKRYSLAGTPIMYVGSHVRILPEFVYDKYPEWIPEETLNSIRHYRNGRLVTRTTAAFNKAALEFDQTPLPDDEAYIQSFTKHIANADIPTSKHESMKASFPTFAIEKGSKWLLRNLTNKEFIRMEAVSTTDVAHVGHSWLTLDTLLYWLICWRGRGDEQRLNWDNLEAFAGVSNTDTVWRNPERNFAQFAFWPIWSGNWAGHSLEVVTDRNLDQGWIDRTSEFDQLAPNLLQTMYAFALSQKDVKPKRYWEEVFEQLGDVVDQVTEYEQDGRKWKETHKIIVSLQVHATALCGCT